MWLVARGLLSVVRRLSSVVYRKGAPQMISSASYRLSGRFVGHFLWGFVTGQGCSFVRHARLALAGQPIEVVGEEHVPPRGPCLVVCNHYSRPGLGAWWTAIAVTVAVAAGRAADADPEVRWVMTAAWTFPGSPWRQRLLTPLTRCAFRRVAQAYGFVNMPPMPPDPAEVEARASAVRQTVRLAQRAARTGGMIGLAPEGRDVLEGEERLPSGVGRFIALLVEAGLPLLPVGVAEAEGRLRLVIGPLFIPALPSQRTARDQAVGQQVLEAIDRCVHAAACGG